MPNPNDGSAVVIGLGLSNNGLVGMIPPSIGELRNLTSLQLQGNQLQARNSFSFFRILTLIINTGHHTECIWESFCATCLTIKR